MGKLAVFGWMRALRRSVLVLGVAAVTAACSATFTNHGYTPRPDELAAVEIGTSRDAVIEAIGTPGSAGVMREEAWFYTSYRIRNYAYEPPQVIERDIVALSFDGRGRVSNVERFGLEDGRVVQLSRRVTTSSVRDLGFFTQIFRNFGRIDIGQFDNSQ